jgi:hypothetical protein
VGMLGVMGAAAARSLRRSGRGRDYRNSAASDSGLDARDSVALDDKEAVTRGA